MNSASKVEGRFTPINWFFSHINDIRYGLTEPLLLRIMRLFYEQQYCICNEEPLITVYTPTYNRSDLLMSRALPSVLAQTYKRFEYVIIGDCCTDDTEKCVTKTNDSRIRFYNIPKRNQRYPDTVENHWLAGPVVAANKGLELSRGKWIARIDDDDTWTSNHLELLLKFAQDENYEFVSGQYLVKRQNDVRIHNGVGALDPYYTRKAVPEGCYNPQIGGTMTWLYRSYLKFIRYNINCWRKKWNRVNDAEFVQRIFKAGTRMGFLKEILGHMMPRPGESTVGLEAYLQAEDSKYNHFTFSNNQ